MNNDIKLLKSLVYAGAKQKHPALSDDILDRINNELHVIEKTNNIWYYLVYQKIIEACNSLNLLRSFGRGPSAGSLVNYCLDITKVNPLDKGLYFEHFLRLGESAPPQIQIDIPVGTQNRVVERLRTLLPNYKIYPIAIKQRGDDYSKTILQLEGESYKKHPCGFIISTNDLGNITVYGGDEKYYVVKDPSNDSIYYSKFDILELDYLTRLQSIVDVVGRSYHPYEINIKDQSVFEIFKAADTDNIFQFNTKGMQRALKQFNPETINDLTLLNAIYRPRSLGLMTQVIENKTNSKLPYYFKNDQLNVILSETYGLLIFQETLLTILNRFAGFSLHEAEVWRRSFVQPAIEKQTEIGILEDLANRFLDGGLLLADIKKLVNMIVQTKMMVFPKAHSFCYALIAYWGAYYKRHFRSVFEQIFGERAELP